ncbi:MAG: DUF2917 domain-containing protein [Burkholderiaceae bacterium]
MSYPMDSVLLPGNQDACTSPAPTGCWRLRPGHALSLRPQDRGVLRVARGRVWLTLGDGYDHVLAAGDAMALEPGYTVVLEPWAAPGAQDAAFAWDTAAPPVACATPAAADWERSVARPLWDLGQALGAAARATGQLAHGLARWTLRRALPGGAHAVPQCRGG